MISVFRQLIITRFDCGKTFCRDGKSNKTFVISVKPEYMVKTEAIPMERSCDFQKFGMKRFRACRLVFRT